METKCINKCVQQVARVKVNKDVVALFMIAKKYKINLLSLLTLYEVYGKDVFLFFYILGGGEETCFIGKSSEELELAESLCEIPKDSNVKLIFSKAKKIADALRRNSEKELTSVTLPLYKTLKEYSHHNKLTGERYLDFYSEMEGL